jgi:prolipoprotein diacylglyceryltransferase
VVFPDVFEKHHPVQLYATMLYAGLFAYLAWLEFHYRTFEWYKSRRKSAQTGFLLSVFLIAHGLISGGLNLVMPPQVSIQGLRLDYLLAVVSVLLGVVILLVRSGRLHDLVKRP